MLPAIRTLGNFAAVSDEYAIVMLSYADRVLLGALNRLLSFPQPYVYYEEGDAAALSHCRHSHIIISHLLFSAIRQESAWLLSNLVVGQAQLVEMVIATGLLPQINALFAGTAGERREVGASLSQVVSHSVSTPHLPASSVNRKPAFCKAAFATMNIASHGLVPLRQVHDMGLGEGQSPQCRC